MSDYAPLVGIISSCNHTGSLVIYLVVFMLRKKDLTKIMTASYGAGSRDVGHFDTGAGLSGHQKVSLHGLRYSQDEGKSKKSTKVSMKKIVLKADSKTGRKVYIKH